MISVIMPVYNGEKYINKTLDCILKQTNKDIEVLAIDDCGTDASMGIVESFHDDRVRIINNHNNMGIAYSRNRGIELASGEYIAFMDDDDVAPLNRFELEVGFLQNHPEIDAVGGRYCSIDKDGNVTGYSDDTLQNPQFIKACLMFYDPLGNGTMLFRKSIVEKNNIRFKDDCCGMEDYLFWIDFSQVGTISNLKDVMLYWRNIEGNETTRYMNELKQQRREKFSEIQRYAIKRNGFDIPEDDLSFLTQMLPEGKLDNIVSKDDVYRLYGILRTMAIQAKDRNMANYNEIVTACRKQFSRRIEHSEMWDL